MQRNNLSNTGILILILSLSLHLTSVHGQQRVLHLTLDEVVGIAREQSPQAILAQHRFRASYWQHRTYQAEFLPNLNLRGTLPDFNRSITTYTLPDGSDRFIERNIINSLASLSLNQNIGLTGGQIFMSSELQRVDNLDIDSSSYRTTPVNIGFRQSLSGYNAFRWQRRIEPLRFEEAKRNYVSAIEGVSFQAVNLFFDLALAQVNLEIAELNYSNTDTLYRIAQGRYNIGTIPENQLLQMELSYLNAGTALNEAILDLEVRRFRLRSFLGYNETVDIELLIDPYVPVFRPDLNKALNEALTNNPDVIQFERQLIEADRDVARARSERGFNADLFAVYGLTSSAPEFADAYKDPQVSQRLQVGLQIPIVDWGLGRGRYRMAQSSQEVIRTQVEQARIDFEQNVYLEVMQFTMQYDQLEIAAKADTIAKKRFDVTRERFLIGRIDVRDLNDAIREQDIARRGYISALRNYWRYYYNLRRLTLYDFERDMKLTEDFDDLIL
ncbi:MAG: TolC family protein [Marinilabiliales bacterium]|nr:MAG: TolC family protein [Marinilabiliales bacterium]